MDDLQELQRWARSLDANIVGGYSTRQDITAKDRQFLYSVAQTLRRRYELTPNQLRYLKAILDKIRATDRLGGSQSEQEIAKTANTDSLEVRHLTVRLAWHDTAWNGRICQDPGSNVFCIGEHSLLSDRVRTRRDLDKESSENVRGSIPKKELLGDYLPPCFWSINAFSPHALKVVHDNPAAPDFPTIDEVLPEYSVISWPFKLSFVRDAAASHKFGKYDYGRYYPEPLFRSRIKKFQNHLREQQTIVFLYCKFSNPVSGEDFQHLLVGCAYLKEKGSLHDYKPTNEQLKAVRARPSLQNFPTLSWTARYTLDFPQSGVRLPYQEYLREINRPGGLSQAFLDEIKVTINEPELVDGFSFVARHVDDDQAIFLIMKIRKSILKIKEHGLEIGYDPDEALNRIDNMLDFAWNKRGYLPGLKPLVQAILELSPSDTRNVDGLYVPSGLTMSQQSKA